MDVTVSELDEKIMAYTGEEKLIEYNSLMQKIYGGDNIMKCKWIEDHECKRENPTNEECICCLLAKIHKDLWSIATSSVV